MAFREVNRALAAHLGGFGRILPLDHAPPAVGATHHTDQPRRKAKAKLFDVDAQPLGGDKVAKLVHKYQHAEYEHKNEETTILVQSMAPLTIRARKRVRELYLRAEGPQVRGL